MDYILDQAVQQVDAGADLLDVNVGMPGIDEKGMMIRTVKALQSIGGTPLQLDSTIPAVMEAALRVYNGKPIVNSVNGEEASLQNILPLVKKYGAEDDYQFVNGLLGAVARERGETPEPQC